MSNPISPLDPSTWFPKPATPAPAQPITPVPNLDIIGKLDALIAAQESTNTLLTALLDQMAQQQQVRPTETPTLQRAPDPWNLFRVPPIFYDGVGKKYYRGLALIIGPPVGPITVAPGTTVIFSGTNFVINPVVFVTLRVIGVQDPTFVANFSYNQEGRMVVTFLVNSIPILNLSPVVQGPLEYNLMDLKIPYFQASQTVGLTFVATNNSGQSQTVLVEFQSIQLQELTPEEAADYLKGV